MPQLVEVRRRSFQFWLRVEQGISAATRLKSSRERASSLLFSMIFPRGMRKRSSGGRSYKAISATQRWFAARWSNVSVSAVIHFGGSLLVEESMRDPRKYFRNNAKNSLELFNTLLDCGVKHVVFSSTAAVYGMPEVVPIPEEHPQRPVNPYGESKLFVERALGWYGQAYDLRWMALRYFPNAAGADPEGELGERHDPETHLIPRAVEASLGRAAALKVFGTDYPTPDGTAIRDYVHVSDLGQAHVLALKHLTSGGPSMALNLGTGTGYSVREVLSTIESVSGRKVPAEMSGRRAGDPASLVARSERAQVGAEVVAALLGPCHHRQDRRGMACIARCREKLSKRPHRERNRPSLCTQSKHW